MKLLPMKDFFSSEIELAKSKGMATAMANAQTAAIERETVAKNANTTATKNMRLAWGGYFIYFSYFAFG